MKYRMIALLLAVCLVTTLLPVPGVWAEEEMELFFSENELVQDKSEESGEQDPMEELKDMNAAIMEALGKKDWEELAAKVKRSGDWRDDLVNVAESQIGYQEEKDGMTLYTRWAGLTEAADWSALFVNWVAAQIGLNSKEFPQGATYEALRSGMSSVKAVKGISRSTYPTAGDLALIETNGQQLVGIVVYVSNDYASVIHGDDNGRVTKETYYVGGAEFKNYVDLNVLMERAGIEVGKGGAVPEIPEGGVAAWTNTNAVYMRSEPTTASKSLTTIKKARTALLVTSAEMQADGYIWYGVEYQKYTGYIRGDLVELDLAAIPTATPAPTKKPEATAVPGCVYCAGVANGVALPMECCYEHLKALGAEYAAQFMSALKEADETMWDVYTKCHAAHVDAGEAAIIPMNGLTVQERVVNIEVRETEAGQETMIFFDIYGANAYQWHEVKSVVNADGTVTETDTIIEGEKSAAVVVTAKSEENTTYSYYCVATIIANGTKVDVASKSTVLNVGDVAITADAILGEEINFTYTVEGAAAYQWYVDREAISAANTAYTGANDTVLTFYADEENSGKVYYCVALDENGATLKTSTSYSYTVKPVSEITDEDLVKYVDELANMTLEDRFTALDDTWNIALNKKGKKVTLADKVMEYWEANMTNVYPNLLCTCGKNKLNKPGPSHKDDCPWYVSGGNQQSDCDAFGEACIIVTGWVTRNATPMEIYNYLAALEPAACEALLQHANKAHEAVKNLLCSCEELNGVLVAPGADHGETCAWHMVSVDVEALASRMESDAEFAQWAASATPEMIARALKVPTLDHAVFEPNEDNTYDLYIVRYAEPVGFVDAVGYLTYGNPPLVIGWVDFSTNTIYPIYNLPGHAPAMPADLQSMEWRNDE